MNGSFDGRLDRPVERPSAVVLSLSVIFDDPRVRRQIDALLADGWTVTSVGFGTLNERRDNLSHLMVPDLPHDTRPFHRAARIASLLTTRFWPKLSLHVWNGQPRHRALMNAVAGIERADLVIANDYTALPAALALASRAHAGLLYDSHEYATGENADNVRWRLLYPPYIRAIENIAIAARAGVTTVSEGIATRIARDYGVERPIVVRNLPSYRAIPERPVNLEPLVHYHGVVVPGRGLETLIDSVPLWMPHFRLRIRGPAPAEYFEALKHRAAGIGVADRIVFERAVPAVELIERASDADIGIHVLPGISEQNSYALPNKLFEYVMAGLAVIVTDLPEMREVVIGERVGALVAGQGPAAIADVVNAMTKEKILSFRRAGLTAARHLCWEHEQQRFLDVCSHLAQRASATM